MGETFINYGNFLFHVEIIVSNTKMKFSNYLETLLGSKVKVKILRALFRFRNKIFTSRELAGQIGVSHTAVLKSLDDLHGMNVISIESHGKSNLIKLNEQSGILEMLSNLFLSETCTLNKLKEELKKMFPIGKIALFGSIASKTEKPNSDIDVLVISDDKAKIEDIISKNQEKFSKKFGNTISAHVIGENEFKRKKNSDFVRGIIKNHIIIRGDAL